MKANLQYTEYSTNLTKATIHILDSTNEFQLFISLSEDEQGKVSKKLNIASVDTETDTSTVMTLTNEEVRQYIGLLNLFIKQLN